MRKLNTYQAPLTTPQPQVPQFLVKKQFIQNTLLSVHTNFNNFEVNRNKEHFVTKKGVPIPRVTYLQQDTLHVKFFRMFIRSGNLENLFQLFTNFKFNLTSYNLLQNKTMFWNLLGNRTTQTKNAFLSQTYSFTPAFPTSHFESVEEAILKSLKDYLPTFSFKVQKVNKQLQKFSRGKSGKYSLTWSYLPPHRRWITVLQWLKRDLLFQKNITLQGKISQGLQLLIESPNETSLAQTRRFVHNFVFKKFRKVLVTLIRHKL